MNILRVIIEKAPDFAISRSKFEGVNGTPARFINFSGLL